MISSRLVAMKDQVVFAKDHTVTAREFQRVLVSSGLGVVRPVDDLDRLQRMLDNANFIVTGRVPARDNELVGIARGLNDGCWCCYVSDLAVSREVQGKGVGRGIIEHARAILSEDISLILFSMPDAVPFYERLGMVSLPHGYWFKRTR